MPQSLSILQSLRHTERPDFIESRLIHFASPFCPFKVLSQSKVWCSCVSTPSTSNHTPARCQNRSSLIFQSRLLFIFYPSTGYIPCLCLRRADTPNWGGVQSVLPSDLFAAAAMRSSQRFKADLFNFSIISMFESGIHSSGDPWGQDR